ncbi:MAG: RNA polymerase sigma factor [Patescibacteria group bacterium]
MSPEPIPTRNKEIEERFLAAYDAQIKSIFRFIYYRTGQEKEEAQELTQEVFMRTWAYLQESTRPIDDIRAFLFQVARNVIADRWRKHKSVIPWEEVDPKDEPHTPPHPHASLDLLILEQHLLKLPERHREILTLRFINDLSTEETGRILNMTSNHVAVLTNRALKKLRKLTPHLHEPT